MLLKSKAVTVEAKGMVGANRAASSTMAGTEDAKSGGAAAVVPQDFGSRAAVKI